MKNLLLLFFLSITVCYGQETKEKLDLKKIELNVREVIDNNNEILTKFVEVKLITDSVSIEHIKSNFLRMDSLQLQLDSLILDKNLKPKQVEKLKELKEQLKAEYRHNKKFFCSKYVCILNPARHREWDFLIDIYVVFNYSRFITKTLKKWDIVLFCPC